MGLEPKYEEDHRKRAQTNGNVGEAKHKLDRSHTG